jgi:tRNA(Arg) A34 adenosine deaminase TadA
MHDFVISCMKAALEEAKKAADRGSVPVGAVMVFGGKIVVAAGNEVLKNTDPTAHAEMLAIRKACSVLDRHLLEGCDLFVTLEPCAMCAQAISLARIRCLYFGAYDHKYGGVEHGARVFQHAIHKTETVGGVLETQCADILKKFFKKKRN